MFYTRPKEHPEIEKLKDRLSLAVERRKQKANYHKSQQSDAESKIQTKLDAARQKYAGWKAEEPKTLDTTPVHAELKPVSALKVAGITHPTQTSSKADIVQAMIHRMPSSSAHAIAKAVAAEHSNITYANAAYYANKMKKGK